MGAQGGIEPEPRRVHQLLEGSLGLIQELLEGVVGDEVIARSEPGSCEQAQGIGLRFELDEALERWDGRPLQSEMQPNPPEPLEGADEGRLELESSHVGRLGRPAIARLLERDAVEFVQGAVFRETPDPIPQECLRAVWVSQFEECAGGLQAWPRILELVSEIDPVPEVDRDGPISTLRRCLGEALVGVDAGASRGCAGGDHCEEEDRGSHGRELSPPRLAEEN